jgi:hypothetical protein
LHVSPQTDNPANDDATRQAIRAARVNPRFLVTSQRKPDALAPESWARNVQIAPVGKRHTWGFVDDYSGPTEGMERRAAAKTLQRIQPSFDATQDPLDAGHVVLDEVRLDTAGTAAKLFRQLPEELRGKVSAYLVGGPKVNYKNPTFNQERLLPAMRGASVNPIMETYGSPTASDKAARGVAKNFNQLKKAGLDPAMSVGGLDRFNNPAGAAWQQGDRLGNQQMVGWVNALRRQLPDAPIGVWPAGTRRKPIAAGRMSSLLKAVKKRPAGS